MRVCYVDFEEKEICYLLAVFAKNEQENFGCNIDCAVVLKGIEPSFIGDENLPVDLDAAKDNSLNYFTRLISGGRKFPRRVCYGTDGRGQIRHLPSARDLLRRTRQTADAGYIVANRADE